MSTSQTVGEWRSRVNPYLQDALKRLEEHGCTFGWAELGLAENASDTGPSDTDSFAEPSFVVWQGDRPIAGWSAGDLQTRVHRAVRLAEAHLGLAVEAVV